jgi:putative membrane protein
MEIAMNRLTVKASLVATLLALGVGIDANAQNTSATTTPPATKNSPPPSADTKSTATTTRTDTAPARKTEANVSANNTTASKPMANGSRLAGGDVKFMQTAAMHGMAEVELGKLAQQQAENANVKDFAARMVKDHSKANDELKPLADAKGVALPSGPDKGHQKDMEKLSKKSGHEFDKAYMDHMVKDHKKDVKEFQKHAKSAKDPELRNFASKNLPTLEEHLRLAQQTHDAIRGGKRGG